VRTFIPWFLLAAVVGGIGFLAWRLRQPKTGADGVSRFLKTPTVRTDMPQRPPNVAEGGVSADIPELAGAGGSLAIVEDVRGRGAEFQRGFGGVAS